MKVIEEEIILTTVDTYFGPGPPGPWWNLRVSVSSPFCFLVSLLLLLSAVAIDIGYSCGKDNNNNNNKSKKIKEKISQFLFFRVAV